MKRSLLAVLIGSLPLGVSAQSTLLPNIVVLGQEENEPNTREVAPLEQPGVAVDGGEILRDAPGVDAGRMGGHGLEPVIRGQGQNRINVLVDGAYLFGGCPNRMDPPTAYANTLLYDRVRILKGVQTLLWGSGGSGGTVLFEHETRVPDKGWGLRYSLATASNDLNHETGVDAVLGGDRAWLRLFGSDAAAGNYRDGDGNEIRSAWKDRKGAASAGLAMGEDTRVEFGIDYDQTRDMLFAGAGMDSPEATARTGRLKFEHDFNGTHLQGIRFEGARSTVDHLMDNYSLRTNTMMWARAPSDSDTDTARLLADLDLGAWEMTLGLDWLANRRDARRYTGMAGMEPTTLNSVLWPDVHISQLGLVLEGARPLEAGAELTAGVRYDRVSHEARKASLDPAGMPLSPNQLYTTYYGTTASPGTEHNIGFLLRYQRPLKEGLHLFTGLSRTMRTADATERYMAANGMTPDARWVGNPNLDPEAHHQLDAGLAWEGRQTRAGLVVYIDQVQDYILRDRAHGQDGILQTDNATIYRNVSARLIGTELTASRRLGKHILASGDLSWVRSENLDDHRPIAQTPPLQGTLRLDRTQGALAVGARVRWAARQNRVEDDPTVDSGVDPRQTPGWAVLDLHGRYRFGSHATLSAGIDNVFDRTYANHLNRANADPFNPQAIQVNEPGMSLWMRLHGKF
ncbi:MAG: TonB-dependent copper receptor [Gammaproteobacteria bacterium]|nr:MAG: TonB-dependent copper receptor [Gammaproteobacteria bacterium]